jgi:predicted cupin superfamily sugar epimerase
MTHPYVDRLGLRAHPEGGWFTETWRTGVDLDTDRGRRAAATGILYLLDAGETSAWHRVASDELWLHHSGGPLVLTLGGDDDRPGETRDHLLGSDVLGGERPQAVVPAGCWQSARPGADAAVLVSCVVAPGFDYADFELLED